MNSKTIGKKLFKIFILLISFIFAIAIIGLTGLNISKYGIYSTYFSSLTKESKTPGLNQGFIPQGLTFFDNHFVSVGYMTDYSASRIYSVDNGFLYLANEGNSLYKFSSDLLKQESGTIIDIGKPVKVNTNTSFIYGKDNYLYIGEFHKPEFYECSNRIEHNGKTNYAIVEKYDISDFSTPLETYSIPEQIQGFCIKDDGTVILSSSWGISSSKFYVYEPKDVIKIQDYNNSATYFLGDATKTIKAPAMSEDLDIFVNKDGKEKIITIFESASNKYFYGKLFFANYIAGMDL